MKNPDSEDNTLDGQQNDSDQPASRVKSETLFVGKRRVVIEHNGVDYLLQNTRQGKLILTK